MAGLRPGHPRFILYLPSLLKDVDARHKAGHDENERANRIAQAESYPLTAAKPGTAAKPALVA